MVCWGEWYSVWLKGKSTCHQQKHPCTKKGLAYYLFENKGTITHDKFHLGQTSLPSWVGDWNADGNILLARERERESFRVAMWSNCHRVSHPSWPSGSPRRSKIKQQSAQHSKPLPHEVGKSGAASYWLFIMPHISKCCTKYPNTFYQDARATSAFLLGLMLYYMDYSQLE